jgi:hypothetical protein
VPRVWAFWLVLIAPMLTSCQASRSMPSYVGSSSRISAIILGGEPMNRSDLDSLLEAAVAAR